MNNRIQLWASSGSKLNKKTWMTMEKMYHHKEGKIPPSYQGTLCFVVFIVSFYSKLRLQGNAHWGPSQEGYRRIMSMSSTSSPWWMPKRAQSLLWFTATLLINWGKNIKAKFSAANTKNNFAAYQALLKFEVAIISYMWILCTYELCICVYI